MATIGSLAVNIVAKTQQFSAGIATAQKGLAGLVSRFGAVQTAVTGLVGGAFASMIRSTIDLLDNVGDLAENLNTTTGAVQSLHYATEQLGGSTAALDKGLAYLTRRIGDAVQGDKSSVSLRVPFLVFRAAPPSPHSPPVCA